MHREGHCVKLANSKKRRPHGMKQSHSPRENGSPCPPQRQTIRKKHPQRQPREPNPNRSPAMADKYCAPVPWDTCPTSLNRSRETHHRGSACPGQQHKNQQSQQSPPTSDITDASNSTRDRTQRPFSPGYTHRSRRRPHRRSSMTIHSNGSSGLSLTTAKRGVPGR